VVVVVL